MKLLQFFVHNKKRSVAVAILLGFVSGVSTAGLISIISSSLTNTLSFNLVKILLLFLLLAIIIATNLTAKLMLNRVTVAQSYKLRIELVDRVLTTPYQHIEKIGAPRIYSLLSEDVQTLAIAFASIPQFTISLAISIGCIVYLCFLSPYALGVLVIVTIPVFLAYRFFYGHATKLMMDLIVVRDKRFRQYDVISTGCKELLTNAARRSRFYKEQLLPTESSFRDLVVAVKMRQEFVQACSQAWYFVLMLSLIGLASFSQISTQIVASYALIALYMRSSLNQIIGVVPQWTQANIVLNNIEELNLASLADEDLPSHCSERDFVLNEGKDVVLAGKNIKFNYDHDSLNASFEIGPINFEWKSGEIVFIVGPNGSGKTTLMKLLAQLYFVSSGQIMLDGKIISKTNAPWYLEQLSITFSDSYLFSDLLHPIDQKQQLQSDLLQEFKLDKKVSINDGKFSTLALSQGQRKRLSLLSAYMEDKSIYLFDEWADNQDPEFKEYFYTTFLPELRERGKLVVAITHDDKYFHIADRHLVLDEPLY